MREFGVRSEIVELEVVRDRPDVHHPAAKPRLHVDALRLRVGERVGRADKNEDRLALLPSGGLGDCPQLQHEVGHELQLRLGRVCAPADGLEQLSVPEEVVLDAVHVVVLHEILHELLHVGARRRVLEVDRRPGAERRLVRIAAEQAVRMRVLPLREEIAAGRICARDEVADVVRIVHPNRHEHLHAVRAAVVGRQVEAVEPHRLQERRGVVAGGLQLGDAPRHVEELARPRGRHQPEAGAPRTIRDGRDLAAAVRLEPLCGEVPNRDRQIGFPVDDLVAVGIEDQRPRTVLERGALGLPIAVCMCAEHGQDGNDGQDAVAKSSFHYRANPFTGK